MAKSTVLRAMRLSEQPTIVVSFFYGLLDLGVLHEVDMIHYISVGLGLVLISIGSFVLNEFSDKYIDGFQLGRQPSEISKRATVLAVSCLVVPGVILGILGGAPLCTGGACVLALFYSLHKVNLKRKAFFDLASLGFSFVVFPYLAPREILASRFQALHAPPVALLDLAFLVFFLAACNLIAMIRDVDSDADAGIRNTTVRIGLENSLRLGLSLTVVAYILGAILVYRQVHWWYYPVFLFIPVLASIYGVGLGARPDRGKIHRYFSSSARVGIATGNVLAAVLLLVILTVLIIFS
jgi:4-hydroxybenzoate polyprenyltransferase